MTTLAPLLTLEQRVDTGEGILDPLGLYPIAESLAQRLAPGVRERQSQPRFVTAIAVSAAVTEALKDDCAEDEKESETWQVFEWYFVEGLVRMITDRELTGLPGILKVREVIKNRQKLDRDKYLKSPEVFGFHGVYKTLAESLRIVNEKGELVEPNGFKLLDVWEKEQGLKGFRCHKDGPGSSKREMIVEAVKTGWNKQEISRGTGWRGWDFFRDHLCHLDLRDKEAEASSIEELLKSNVNIRQLMEFIITKEGKKKLEFSSGEKDFYQALRKYGTSELRNLIDTILNYEAFSRVLKDAFDDCCMLMTSSKGFVKTKELAGTKAVKVASEKIPGMFCDVAQALEGYTKEAGRFKSIFERFSVKTDPVGFVDTLIKHHKFVQENKQPDGKAMWVVGNMNDGFAIRMAYRTEHGALMNGSYVHPYRTRPLRSFLVNLGVIKA